MSLLDRLLASSIVAMADATDRLERGAISIGAWEREMETLLARYHTASFLAGRAEQLGIKPDSALLSERRLSREERAVIKATVKEQIDYLKGFRGDIAKAEEWQRRFNARAAMYGASAKATYWQGRTLGMGLPGWPAVGTQCLSNCGCSWAFSGKTARWVRGKTDSCATCIDRERTWSAVRIA